MEHFTSRHLGMCNSCITASIVTSNEHVKFVHKIFLIRKVLVQ